MYPLNRLCTAGKIFAFPCRDNLHAIMGRRNNPITPYFTATTTPLACSTPGEGLRDPVVNSG